MSDQDNAPYVFPVQEPSLRDVLDLHTKEVMLALNCHGIAIVTAFYPESQTVDAAMAYTKTIYVENSEGQVLPQQEPYPLLLSVPVISLCGGRSALTFPIAKGDQCLILFNDRDLDNWFTSRGTNTGSPASGNLHSFSDALAIVGLNAISNYDATAVVLDAGHALIALKNEVTSLRTILVNLINAIGSMTVGPGTFTAGVTPVTGSGTVSGVSAIIDQVEDLLK